MARPAGQQPAQRAVKPPTLTHIVPEPNAEKNLKTKSSGDESRPNRGGGAKGSTRQEPEPIWDATQGSQKPSRDWVSAGLASESIHSIRMSTSDMSKSGMSTGAAGREQRTEGR